MPEKQSFALSLVALSSPSRNAEEKKGNNAIAGSSIRRVIMSDSSREVAHHMSAALVQPKGKAASRDPFSHGHPGDATKYSICRDWRIQQIQRIVEAMMGKRSDPAGQIAGSEESG